MSRVGRTGRPTCLILIQPAMIPPANPPMIEKLPEIGFNASIRGTPFMSWAGMVK